MADFATGLMFDSATLGECGTTTGAPAFVTTPAPPNGGDYCIHLRAGQGDTFYTRSFNENSGKYAGGIYFYVDELNISPNFYPVSFHQNKKTLWQLHLDDNGVLELEDANLAVIATSGSVIEVDAFNRIEFLFEKGDGDGTLIVLVNEVEVFNVTGQDFDAGTTGSMQIKISGQGGIGMGPCNAYCPYMYILKNATSIDDLKGEFVGLGYSRDEDVAASNVTGDDDWDSGTWENAANFDTADFGRFTARNRLGVVTTNYSGGSAHTGPYGDSRIGSGDKPFGATYLHQHKCDSCPANQFYPHRGKIDQSTPNTDGTTKGNGVYRTVIGFVLYASDAAAYMPDPASDYFQIGAATCTTIGTKAINMYGHMCALFLSVGVAQRGVTLGAGVGGRTQAKDVLMG